jgi:AraC-like DNA-binding protein
MLAETTPALYPIKLLEVLQGRSVDCRPVIAESGFTALELNDREREVPIDKYLRMVSSALRHCDIQDLGFLVGEHTGTLEHGVLGYALLSSANLGESLQRYTRYQGVVGPLLRVELQVKGELAEMSVRPLSGDRALPLPELRYFIQEWLATWNPWSGFIGERAPFFELVTLGLPDQDLASIYERHLRCPVCFREGQTIAQFPASYMQKPLQYTNQTIGALCHQQCELLLEAQQLEHGLTAEIHRQLARRPGNLPGMEEVARQLGMTTRTLRRHLESENTRFQDIVINHRIAMARRYLQETSLPVNEIASLVGYADQANFFRTFRDREGMTPQDFRQTLQA